MNAELTFDLLEHGTSVLEQTHVSTGRVNLAAARFVGDASLLLGYLGFARRCERFLQDASPRSFWDGVITNITVDRDSVSESARSLTPIEQIEHNHQLFYDNYPATVMTEGMGDHIAPCRTRDYDSAYANAGPNEFRWHEVAVAQAVNGDLALALPRLDDVDCPTLRRHMRLVFAIELFRRGNASAGSEMYKLLQSGGINEYTAGHLALGVSNRVPWVCYPFADY